MNSSVRWTILDGETLLFCGSDVARALGYARPGKAIIDHCKGVLKRDTLTSGGILRIGSVPKALFQLLGGKLHIAISRQNKLPQCFLLLSDLPVGQSLLEYGSGLSSRKLL